MNETEARVFEILWNLHGREIAERCYQQVAWALRTDDEITDALIERLAADWIAT